MAESQKQSIKKVSKDAMAAGTYRAEFSNGKVVEFPFASQFPGYETLNDVQKGFIAYGVKQKLDDSMAGAVDVAEAIEELESTIEALQKGKWTLRVAGEGAGEAGGLFARAFAEARGTTLADAKAQLAAVVQKNMEKNAGATERQVLQAVRVQLLKQDAKFAEAYNRMSAERAAKQKSKVNIEL